MNYKCQISNAKKMLKPKVVISGIGTGGHYFPAVVVAKELLRRKVEVIFLVRKGFFEEEVARMYGLKIFTINTSPFYGKATFNKILSIFSIVYSVLLLNSITKGVVGIAFGGFGALPLLVSCLINRSCFYLFEPNRIPGRATKLFASRANKVFLGLPLAPSSTGRILLKGDFIITGIPIRQEFKTSFKKDQKKSRFQRRVLFLGGSQGARRLNSLALEIQRILPKEYQIVIVCGRRDYKWVNSRRNGRTKVIPFTFSLWDEMRDADAIVSRSGALAGYEILSSNRPVLFIPFPFAIDNHQYYNAEYFTEVGEAIMFEEKNLTKDVLAQKIEEMLQKEVIKKGKIILDAEKRIADVILKEN